VSTDSIVLLGTEGRELPAVTAYQFQLSERRKKWKNEFEEGREMYPQT
jgi:hypothetical protein